MNGCGKAEKMLRLHLVPAAVPLLGPIPSPIPESALSSVPGFVSRKKLPLLLLVSSLFWTGCRAAAPVASNVGTPSANAASGASAAQPAAGNPAPAASSSAQTPAPAVAAPAPVTITVAAGRDVKARLNGTIDSRRANVGDRFSGNLAAPLKTSSGEVVFEAGLPLSGRVVSVRKQGRFAGAGVLAIELEEIAGKSVAATEYIVSRKGKGKRTAALIGGGAGAGALIGGLAGGGHGALFGALIGGGAGTAGAGLTGNKPLLIPSGSVAVFELRQPLSRTIERPAKP